MGVLFCDGFQKYVSSRLDIWEKSEVLQFIGFAMGGILIAVQALMSYKRATALEDTARAQADAANAQADAANTQARATEEQAKANQHTEQGQRQERLKNAIEHLGHESDSVRLGGAYELFHLAEDTKSMCQTVLDILCAHIRRTTGERKYREEYKSNPSEEIQSILSMLFVQEHDVFEDLPIDLRGSWLTGAELRNARLRAAILREVNLQKADLIGAHLERAVLARAQLQGAILQGAHMQEAKLHSATLIGANFNDVNLQGATLADAHLERTDLRMVHLEAADFDGAFLTGSNLSHAYMQEALLSGADLKGANLQGARLHGTHLNDAHLQGANLRHARLYGAHLNGAHLQGACVSEAHFNYAVLDRADLRGVRCKGCLPAIFAQRIMQVVDSESDLSTAIFAGGLTNEDLDSIGEGVFSESANALREVLASHICQPIRHSPLKDSGTITGSYTQEEAEKWIAEYQEATAAESEEDG